ncbi:outer membrane protein assembly factor BamB family protein [Streptomyces litchfieldiae]|uniref:outer membrane protein assembly factor BamB family protein n=1 Tax=Streptomyces litchfieldiae TaxID=3075543 RepID=UPI00374E03B9
MVWRSPFQDSEPEPVVGALRPIESLVSDTTVFLPLAAGGHRKPTALDGLTGEEKWKYDGTYQPDGPDGPVASVPGGFIFPTQGGTVCLAAYDGAERWHDEADSSQGVGITDRYVMLRRTKQERLFQRWTTVRILDSGNAREFWTGQFDSNAVSGPASDGDGLIVVLDNGGTLWALRP